MEVLQKRPTILALAAVAWFTWGGLAAEPDANGKSLDGLPRITPEDVELRLADAPSISARTPFPPFLAPQDFGFPGGIAVPEDDEPEVEEEPEVIEKPPEPRIHLEQLPEFVLRLDSIMAFGAAGGHARINGHTVGIGDVIANCDPEAPPTLVDLDGLSATIRHRGATHVLHLDTASRLVVGGETIRHVLPPLDPSADETEGGP
jgi:hypothetical protein